MSATRISSNKARKKKDRLKPRKAPVQDRSQDTVDVILNAAAHVLEQRGLAGFNTNRVAERAGVSIGSLYQYFPNKDSLMVALIERFEEQLAALLKEAVTENEGMPFSQAVRSLLRSAIAAHTTRPALHRILEFEERRLLPDSENAENTRKIVATVSHFLKTHGHLLPGLNEQEAARDVLIMVRAFTDSALELGESDLVHLENRLFRAVSGYLQLPQ